MANAFRDYYEDLYKSREDPAACKTNTNTKANERHRQKHQQKLPSVTEEEIDTALHELKRCKCADTKKVTAEILKHVGPETKKIIAEICTDILKGGKVQEPWRKN